MQAIQLLPMEVGVQALQLLWVLGITNQTVFLKVLWEIPSQRGYRTEAEQKFDGLDFTFDYITGLPPDNDGNIAAFHMEEAQHELHG